MEKENDALNIAYVKNLSKQTFSSTINLQVDSKANIKTILNVSSYVFDEKVETASGKAVVNGKIGIKVLYIDTDNITNTLTETQPFSENLLDNAITSDCFITLNNISSLCEVEAGENNHKVKCNVTYTPALYVNLAFKTTNEDSPALVTKKSSLNTNIISNKIHTSFNYSTTLETRDEISKILFTDSAFYSTNVLAQDGYAVVEGKLYSKIVYELIENEEVKIKELSDIFTLKTDVEIENLSQGMILDLMFNIDRSKEEISTELEDGNSIVTINNNIKVHGVALKEIELDIVEDLFCVKNELSISKSSREFICENKNISISEDVFGEISLNKDEIAIDEIIGNSNVCTEITNTYIKNNFIFFEGIINSTFIYIDEEKEFKSKQLELPFVINTKIEADNVPTNLIDAIASTTKVKVRRGTIIELEYKLDANIYLFNTNSKEVVDNITFGSPLDFSKYDYQIYITKPNETIWDLCKRVKCYPEDLNKCNKNLPLTFTGNEKIIIKR